MPVPLRSDFDAADLRRIARKSKDGPQARRLLALAAIYEGARRTEAARIGGVTLQIVRDWVMKFNAHGPEGLIDGKPPGRSSKLTHTHRATLAGLLDSGPIPAIHGVVRWRLIDLAQWLFEEFRISISKQTLSRELRAMGYRKLSARPRHHAKNEHVADVFKKSSQPVWQLSRSRSAASRSRSGSPMRQEWVRKTRSPVAGPSAAQGPQPQRTRGRSRPASSAPSARLKARALGLCLPAVRQRP
jgi:transposase